MIRIIHLSKTYDKRIAIDDLSLEIPPGELFVLLGPNGAGKTTTMRILATLLRPTAGEAFVGGCDVVRDAARVRQLIGYVPDTPALYDKLTGREFLEFVASVRRLNDTARIERMLNVFNLDDAANELIETYSLGMRRKTALAAALLHQPRALLLDEPTGGLDPQSARTMKDLLKYLAEQGVAVLMTTHILEIAEQLCHRVGILHDGKLLAVGTPDELREKYGNHSLENLFLKLTGTEPERAIGDLWNG